MESKTPFGEVCIIPLEGTRKLIMSQARGNWQQKVTEQLVQKGYVIGYQATGTQLKGKAKNYQSRYAKSLVNLMNRIENVLVPTPFGLIKDEVGPKGAFGWYLAEYQPMATY